MTKPVICGVKLVSMPARSLKALFFFWAEIDLYMSELKNKSQPFHAMLMTSNTLAEVAELTTTPFAVVV